MNSWPEMSKLAKWSLVLFLFVVGMWSFTIPMFGPDYSSIPGTIGKARTANYALEHFHSFCIGKTDDYWNAPFMHPAANAIAYSDGLLGTAPIYSALRSFGSNRETSFQAWIAILFALNFWACFFSLKQWSGRVMIAGCGAFIFAFGIFQLGQLDHWGMLPRFMVPIAFMCAWKYLEERRTKFMFMTVLVVAYQFYCSIHIGIFLLFSIVLLSIGSLFFHRLGISTRAPRSKTMVRDAALATVALAALLAPLALPYIEIHGSLRGSQYNDAQGPSLGIASYWNSHPAASSWQDLSIQQESTNAEQLNHSLYPGILPWLAVIAGLAVALGGKYPVMIRKRIGILLIGWTLNMLFSIDIGGSTFYQFVLRHTRFSMIDPTLGSVTMQVMFTMFILVPLASLLSVKRWTSIAIAFALPALVILDNKIDVRRIGTFNKWASRDQVGEVTRHLTGELSDQRSAVAYMPVLPIMEPGSLYDHVIEIHTSAMLAAQEIGVPIVNAYSRKFPKRYQPFFERLDKVSLDYWLASQGKPNVHVRAIDGLFIPIERTDTVTLQAADGNFISTNTPGTWLLVADRPTPLLWGTYRSISTSDGRIALLAHNGNFVCAELLQHQQVSATAPDLGDFGLFKKVDLGDGWIALQAHNDRFLSVNDEGLIHASSDSIGVKERFKFTVINSQR